MLSLIVSIVVKANYLYEDKKMVVPEFGVIQPPSCINP